MSKLTRAQILITAAASFALSVSLQAGNFGINTFTPGSQLSVRGNLSVGSTFASVAAPLDGAYLEGQVGIGTTSRLASLHVAFIGGASVGVNGGGAFANWGNNNTVWSFTPSQSAVTAAIVSDGHVLTTSGYGFWASSASVVASDARLKNVVGVSNTEKDLSTLKQIAITDYTYIDKVGYGSVPQKRVIAQQVQKVYPQAVRTFAFKDVPFFMPNIYAMASKLEKTADGFVVTMAKEHGLKAGESVSFRLGNDREVWGTVVSANATQFTVQSVSGNLPVDEQNFHEAKQIFVYGKRIMDQLGVDYDAIAMLNVSATQELAKQNEQLRQNQAEQKAKLAVLEEDNARLKAALADVEILKKAVAAMQLKSESRPVAYVK